MTKYITLAFALFTYFNSFAQTENNESALTKFKTYFNKQQSDSIYLQWNEKARAAVSKKQLDTLLEKQLYPLGKIQEVKFLEQDENLSQYKISFQETSLKLILSTDSSQQIETLYFQPYKEAPLKDTLTKEDNRDTLHIEKDTSNLQSSIEHTIDDLVDSLALQYTLLPNTSGLAVGVLNQGRSSYYYYGETTKGNKVLPGPETLFEIGSITQTFTATLLAHMALQDSVKLDDPIIKYLPDSIAQNSNLKGITFRNLATHTSGLPRLPSNLSPSDSLDPYKNYDRGALFSYLKKYEQHHKPDSIYEYSNLGYGLLGELLAHKMKTSYNELIKDIISRPLNLPSLSEFPDGENLKGFIPTYNKKGELTPHWHFLALSAAGSLKATAPDLLKYAEANINPPKTILGKAITLTHKPSWLLSEIEDLGLAWHITIDNFQELFWHNGETFGSSSFIAFVPEKKVAVVILSNAAQSVDNLGLVIIKKLMGNSK
ncbi:MAG TPA: serine hydrolase [Pseudosphingobacterium sp.]|nr:serine hydrolase [Pseudosphingobacterium sp.]